MKPEEFDRFSSSFLKKTVVNGNYTRESVDSLEGVQTVNIGEKPVFLHSEMAYTPFKPETLFFFCEIPPKVDGETILLDGCALFKSFLPAIKKIFFENNLKYSFSD